MKKIFKALLLCFMATTVMTMLSCGDDEGEDKTQAYQKGFTEVHATTLDQMQIITDAFDEELNSKSDYISLTGSEKGCDAKVKAACERADNTIKSSGMKIKEGDYYTYTVTNVKSNKVVFSKKYE